MTNLYKRYHELQANPLLGPMVKYMLPRVIAFAAFLLAVGFAFGVLVTLLVNWLW